MKGLLVIGSPDETVLTTVRAAILSAVQEQCPHLEKKLYDHFLNVEKIEKLTKIALDEDKKKRECDHREICNDRVANYISGSVVNDLIKDDLSSLEIVALQDETAQKYAQQSTQHLNALKVIFLYAIDLFVRPIIKSYSSSLVPYIKKTLPPSNTSSFAYQEILKPLKNRLEASSEELQRANL